MIKSQLEDKLSRKSFRFEVSKEVSGCFVVIC
jgi:hypothetical protein